MVALAKTNISVSEICALNREIILGGGNLGNRGSIPQTAEIFLSHWSLEAPASFLFLQMEMKA